MSEEQLDFDWLVIGSGFGGSTAALRLAEKGYRFGVLECGRRFRDEELPKTTWELSRYYWMPTRAFFGGEGPERTGCVRCGSCMVGCRYGAKNTLVKNYLHFAERLGVEIQPERTVTDIRPRDAADGSDGYVVTREQSGAWLRRGRRRLTARGVIVAAGALGTNKLLFSTKLRGSLPEVSDRLGHLVRTNSESILAVTAPDDARDFTNGVAITSSIYPDPDTHIETVTWGEGADSQSLLVALMTEAGRRGTQPLALLANMVRHPLMAARAMRIRGWSRRTLILLIMQSLDRSMRLKSKRRWPNGNVVLTTEQDPNNPNPDKIPAAYRAAEWIQSKIGGTAQAIFTEAMFSIPITAHVIGGATIGRDPQTGVIDHRQSVFGYRTGLRRLSRPRQRWGQPQPDDHSARRARHERDPGQQRLPAPKAVAPA